MSISCVKNVFNAQDGFPSSFKYVVDAFKEDADGTISTVRSDVRTKAEAEEWLREFESESGTQWRSRRTFPENTPKVIFKVSIGADKINSKLEVFLLYKNFASYFRRCIAVTTTPCQKQM